MKKLTGVLLRAIAPVVLVALSAGALFAQDFTGTWQGTVQAPGQERRLVVKVTADAGALKVVLYSIDRGPAPYAGTITFTGTTVRMLIPSIDGTYDGKLSADGTEITGTWAQGAYLVHPEPETCGRGTPRR